MAEAAEKNRQSICISQNSLVWQDDSVFKLYYYCMNCACRQKAEICARIYRYADSAYPDGAKIIACYLNGETLESTAKELHLRSGQCIVS